MLGKLLIPEIQEALRARDFDALREALTALPVPEAAEILIDIPDDDEAVAFRVLPRRFAAEVFAYLPPADQEVLLHHLSTESLTEILNAISPDDRTRLLEELPGEVTQRLLAMLSPQELKVARQLLGYPEKSVGRLMTPEYVAVRMDWGVGEAFEHIRKVGREAETLHVVYVVDEKGKLYDDLRLGTLVLAGPGARIRDLCDGQFTSLSAFDDQETAVAVFKKYDRVALPVVDSGGVLLGIVTIDDVLDVAEEEASEDIQKFGGSGAIEDSYFDTPAIHLIRKRAGWLCLLFVGGMFTATAIRGFAGTLRTWDYLMVFLPLIISSGGNSGTQAAALMLRGLALNQLSLGHWWRVLRREIYIGTAMGAILCVIGFARVLVGGQSPVESMAVGLALVGIVLVGTLVGAMLPFFFKRIGLDPAVASGPLVASFVDVTGILIYLTVATLLLPPPAP